MTSEDGVRITQREVFDKVVGLEDGLGRVEALLEKHVALEEARNAGIEVRLENHGTRLGDQGTQIVSLESRVTQSESDIRAIQNEQAKRDSRKAPWWNVVGAVVGIIGVPGILIGLLITLSNVSQALTHLP